MHLYISLSKDIQAQDMHHYCSFMCTKQSPLEVLKHYMKIQSSFSCLAHLGFLCFLILFLLPVLALFPGCLFSVIHRC